MTDKFKVLGLALVAALALSVAVAPAALADEFHSGSGSGTTHLTGEGIAQWDTPAGNIKCNYTMTATYPGTTATQVTFDDITYTGCIAFGLAAHVDMMGCHYLVTGVDAINGIVHIVCPTTAGGVTDEITVTPTQGGVPVCHIDIPEQTYNINIVNTPATPGPPFIPNDVHIAPNAMNITYNVTYIPPQVPPKCGQPGLHHDGKYTGATTVTAFDDPAHLIRVPLQYT